MIHPDSYASLGELLYDALLTYKSETALVEYSRKRESRRFSFLEAKREVDALTRAMQELGVGAGSRVALLMSNQPTWLLAATAALLRGAVLVPIDYKLKGDEQRALLKHAKPTLLVTEYGEWRKLGGEAPAEHAWVTDAPESAELGAALRFEQLPRDVAAGEHVARQRSDQATLVYSSGTGGDPKGCVLTHANYLEQFRMLSDIFPMDVGDRYFSILPTNHAIDFMVGFIGPFASGATVVHQRALRPEMVNYTLRKAGITHMAVVPLLLEAFERRIREKKDEAGPLGRRVFDALVGLNVRATLDKPRHALSRSLLKPVHDAFGGTLKTLFCGGAFVDPARARFFYDLGIPVVIGYGLTEACTVLTVNDLAPFRADSVGRPLDGVELEIRSPDPESGIGEVWAKSPTVFDGYLDDPEQTAEVLHEGWLKTGDLGWLDPSGHLHLVGRSKNMIVTPGGKNIYPEDIEGAFDGLPCDELAVFATGYVWPGVPLPDEGLVAVVQGAERGLQAKLEQRNKRLPDFKRVTGILPWDDEFPRTASMKVKRAVLAGELREKASLESIIRL
jgi:long-chain acyl-CoA synthetase